MSCFVPAWLTGCSLLAMVAGGTTSAAAAPPELRAGAAAVELEADDGMVIGGGIGPGFAQGQEGKLRAVATVVEGPDGTRVALVSCDILMINRDYLDPSLRAIEAELGIPFANVLVSATHTHHAPSTVTIHGYERVEPFCARVRDGVVAAVRAALARLKDDKIGPCQLRFRLGEESSVGQNSRLLLSDDTIFWVGKRDDEVRPTGPFDPDLPVLAFQRRAGGVESLIFNHSTHLIGVYTPGKRSPGFYCLAAQELEAEFGGTVMFVAGAFGSTHNLKLPAAEMAHRIKASIRASMAVAQPMAVALVRSRKREVTYRVRKFDEAKEDEAVSYYCKTRMMADPSHTIDVFRRMRKELASKQGEERKTWVQAMRIGDVAWVSAPGELFTQLGVEIKRRSPFRYTYIAGTANDYVGYIPDAEAYARGGYQTWTGFHSFVERGTGEKLVETAVELLGELQAEVK